MKKTNKLMNNYYLTLLFLIIAFGACKKEQFIEQIDLASPSIKIESAKQISLSTYEVVVHIDIGEGQDMMKAEIVLDDITVLSSPDITMDIRLTGEKKQIDTIILNTEYINHDFNVKASLKTNKYTYYSDPKIIRSIKNNFVIEVFPNDMYSDLKNNIADFINMEDQFSIIVYYTNIYNPKSVEVKLNRTISLNHTLNFEYYWFGEYIETTGSVKIPQNIEPGIYEVYVYIDGFEFKTDKNIKVLKGTWQEIKTDYMAKYIGEYAWFVKENDVYIFGGKGETGGANNCPVWKYNIPNNTREQKNDFPHSWDPQKNEILSLQLSYNNEAYVLFRDDSIEVWNYNDEIDEWHFVTTYPGKANRYLTSFIYHDKLYLGGGTRYFQLYGDSIYYDYWEFDFNTEEWQKRKDIPMKFSKYKGGIPCKTKNNELYVFSYANELWQYHPDDDSWIKKKKFPGPIRIVSNFIENDNKLYLIGGLYSDYGYGGLKDCWEYSIESDSWEMLAFMPELYGNGIAFSHNNSIYAGLGWVISGYYSYTEQNFYKLNL